MLRESAARRSLKGEAKGSVDQGQEVRVRGVVVLRRGTVTGTDDQRGLQTRGTGDIELLDHVAEEQHRALRQLEPAGDGGVGLRGPLGAGGRVVELFEQSGQVAILGVGKNQFLRQSATRGEDAQPDPALAPGLQRVLYEYAIEMGYIR